MNNYCVYKHTSPNGKCYIGMTGTNPISRWQRGHGYQGQTKFFNAILKYGWQNFTHEILADGLSREEATAKEAELIAAYDSVEHGYNVLPGAPSETVKKEPAPPSNIGAPRATRTAICQNCGKEFVVKSGNLGLYCGLDCRYAAMRKR